MIQGPGLFSPPHLSLSLSIPIFVPNVVGVVLRIVRIMDRDVEIGRENGVGISSGRIGEV
jgi:hypothetical protein